ncbi:pleiotropic drug resistance ABC transporter [Crucibulum laeve]|uniref:Pleiotropic drug resistance ABC transporter n=1 Tax=Crucibulum laeve TaxID=68775 RepID=A0A5C3LI95_9AGAR|nr:pleiotropic drug resistance ABC transporter [Crucibulum laeve]
MPTNATNETLENEAAGPSNVKQDGQRLTERQRRRPAIGRGRQSKFRHSMVSMDFFDPEGARQLSRMLSTVSRSRSATDSENTLTISEPFDLENSLRAYLKKVDEADIPRRHLGVLFENLRVVGLGATTSYQPTLGSYLNPYTLAKTLYSLLRPPVRDIVSGFSGVVWPGEMLLVLGRPGAGCSTFLKVLANQRSEYHEIHGDVHYDSLMSKEISKNFRGDVQYCPEEDIHFAPLTVDQTIRFAIETRAPQNRLPGQSRSDYIRLLTDVYLTIFGLKHVRNTPVGNEKIRGVSGGEKKRVSICETLATRSLMTSWDNTTRGLDASTALEFVRALRIATDLSLVSTIVAIYQAGETLYRVFDKVCLIYEGRLVYFGPASHAKQYFIDMGYIPAPRQTTADFLVAVTDPNARTMRGTQGLTQPIPQTAEEFEAYYRNSPVRSMNIEDMGAYRRERMYNEEMATAYKRSVKAEQSKYAFPKLRIVMIRRVRIMKGDWTPHAFHIAMFIFQAIIISTTFIKIPEDTSNYFSRGGVLFFSVLVPSLFQMSEIPSLFSQRPVIDRQQKAAMYHPMVDALAMTLVDVPVTFITVLPFCCIIYFVVRLQQTAGQFFIFFLFVFIVAITMTAFFRALAAAFKSAPPAQAVAGVLLLALLLYTGYQIPKPSMIGALRWISYINPIRYAFEGVMTNEFHTLNGVCSSLIPSGPGYSSISLNHQACSVVGSEPGQRTVNGNKYLALSFSYYRKYLWRDFGILVAFGAFFILCLLILTEINTGLAGQTNVTLFKRGSKPSVTRETATLHAKDDEEKSQTTVTQRTPAGVGEVEREKGDPDTGATVHAKETHMPEKIFSWQHLKYTVIVGGDHRKLLDDVSGYVVAGKLTALMGESGAGKTTLLNVLAGRVGTGVVSGERLFNGRSLPPDFQAQTGYCQQTDTHVSTNTVREALRFSARLRQPRNTPRGEKDAYADQCLKMCGLEAYGDAMVGSLGVEYRKRTTIGVELAAKPRLLLFLDEPTSGLDSQSAWAILAFLRSLADNGQAILCTCRQPSAELFQVFDRLLLLQKGGQTVYYGDLGNTTSSMIGYFENAGSRQCKPDENPAEFMLDVIGAGATAVTDKDWRQVWLQSSNRKDLLNELEKIHEEGRQHPPVESTLQSEFAAPWLYQTKELLKRQFQSSWRDPIYLLSKLVLNIFAGLFTGFTFFKAKDTIQGTQNRLFAIFMGTFLSAPLGNQMHVPYMQQRSVYEIRERSSRMYHWSALTTAQLLCEIPWNILGSSLFFLCWYWAVGFPNSRAGYIYFIFGVLFPLYYTTISLAVASISPSAEIAGLIFSVLFTFVITFDGVMQPFALLGWWKWMYHLSPFTYLIEGLVGEAIGHQSIRCTTKELVTIQPPSGQTCHSYMSKYIATRGGYLTNPTASSDCYFCSSRTTDEWLKGNFNISYHHHWRDFGFFCAYIVFNAFMLYVLTYLRASLSNGGTLSFIKKPIASAARLFSNQK